MHLLNMFSLKTINNTDPGSYKFTIHTKRNRTKNANKTNERFTRTIRNDRKMKRTIHETNEPITRTKCKRTENKKPVNVTRK